ncbi:hypothetical protein DFJ58DRAFT_474557 [Suillus subalutaceus]|uniref:uncharacterized protein n=1 Tax=Suillus subalutaceus TaxID=48586 RepID=UPI001B86EC20|nr:uncharacterized protein DFJ58DRAFT_474557 [Suillus subalutaceus]KAG1848068.1 hypothetical protein DFJ58DRAFT_474557 [Suillus subalutaceus]
MLGGLVDHKDDLKLYYEPLRVPTFLPITNAFNCKRDTKIISLVGLVVMVIFGGLQFFAWFSLFPTHLEQGEYAHHHWLTFVCCPVHAARLYRRRRNGGRIVLVLHFTSDIFRCTYSLTDTHGY